MVRDHFARFVSSVPGWTCTETEPSLIIAKTNPLFVVAGADCVSGPWHTSLTLIVDRDAAQYQNLLGEDARLSIEQGKYQDDFFRLFEAPDRQFVRSTAINGWIGKRLTVSTNAFPSAEALAEGRSRLDGLAEALVSWDVGPLEADLDAAGYDALHDEIAALLRRRSETLKEMIPVPPGAVEVPSRDYWSLLPSIFAVAGLPAAQRRLRFGDCTVTAELSAGPLLLTEAKQERGWANLRRPRRQRHDDWAADSLVMDGPTKALVGGRMIVRVIVPYQDACNGQKAAAQALFDTMLKQDYSAF